MWLARVPSLHYLNSVCSSRIIVNFIVFTPLIGLLVDPGDYPKSREESAAVIIIIIHNLNYNCNKFVC